MAFEIVEHKSKYNHDFYILNKSWIEGHWELEEADNQTLLKPEKSIIQMGGQIFFLLHETKVIGTVAMIPNKTHFRTSENDCKKRVSWLRTFQKTDG